MDNQVIQSELRKTVAKDFRRSSCQLGWTENSSNPRCFMLSAIYIVSTFMFHVCSSLLPLSDNSSLTASDDVETDRCSSGLQHLVLLAAARHKACCAARKFEVYLLNYCVLASRGSIICKVIQTGKHTLARSRLLDTFIGTDLAIQLA